MAAGHSLKSLLSRRRRRGAEEGEDENDDEEGPVVVEDSQSEGSVLSEADDDRADASSLGGSTSAAADIRRTGSAPPNSDAAAAAANANGGRSTAGKKARAARRKGGKKEVVAEPSRPTTAGGFQASADTETMMNGLRIDDKSAGLEPVGFGEEAAKDLSMEGQGIPSGSRAETAAEKQRREHADYRKKRDNDPSFIPNRGQFFMHDARGQPNGQGPPPLRGVWQTRGRGRAPAAVGGPFSPANQMAQAERAAEQPWKHDLHDTINEEQSTPPVSIKPPVPTNDISDSNRAFGKPGAPQPSGQPRVITFSSTTLVYTVQIRVLLPGMSAPVAFSEVPWKHYIRLPDHRPPLRRDKPVRISLPGNPPRHVFPTEDRSFVFIPRQMRPNQQGFRRGYPRSSISGHGYSSRRTSVYGGSIYSDSMSRRSSLAGGARDNAFSPASFAGSFTGAPPPARPVVRLPHPTGQPFSGMSSPNGPLSGQQTPSSLTQIHTYPLPQQPAHQGTPTTTVHQPRPQKVISVTGIESPAMQHQGSQDSLPFQNQLPPHMGDQGGPYGQPQSQPQGPPPPYFSPRQSFAYAAAQRPQNGTPLSRIPEQAINAPNFQPMPYGQPAYYPVYPPQQPQAFYYPSPGPNGYAQPMQMYMGPPQNYGAPPPQHQHPPSQPTGEHLRQQQQQQQQQSQPPSQPSSSQQHRPQQQSQSGMVAHESNGMVFYLPASEANKSSDHHQYQPAEGFVPSYAMPGLPPAQPPQQMQQQQQQVPAPEFFYPNPGMQEMGAGVYYPASQ